MEKQDIRQLEPEHLGLWLKEKNLPAFRAKQINQWIWQKSSTSFEQMTNLSKDLRDELNDHFNFRPAQIDQVQQSKDGTIKFGFRLFDGKLVEGVTIPFKDRITACVSSQVGCSLSCKFCATGYMGHGRNLSAAEIYDQVALMDAFVKKESERGLTNIVFMGMGEPLLNYKQVKLATHHICGVEGLDWSPKRITLSTAGISKMIHKMAEEQVKFNLALSLHAANDEKRNQIMPINEKNNLASLKEALRHFYDQTKNKVTFEYTLMQKFNDSLEDAAELVELLHEVPSKLNIIEYNPISAGPYTKSEEKRFNRFCNYLGQNGVQVNVRRSRGKDIDAACGQLATKA